MGASDCHIRLNRKAVEARVKEQTVLRPLLVVGLESVEHEHLVPRPECRMSMCLMWRHLHRVRCGDGDCFRDIVWFFVV